MASLKKLNIVIDSTHHKMDVSFSKQEMLFLKALAKLDLIKLHIPWVIFKECTTSVVDNIEGDLKKAIQSLENLSRKGLPEGEAMQLNKIADDIKGRIPGIPQSIEAVWNDFISETKSILHPFYPEDSTNVFENYFGAGKPFKTLKSRDDIPDAFIFETLKRIALKTEVIFITGDKNFREKCVGENNIRTFSDFNALFNADAFTPVQTEYDTIEMYSQLRNELLLRKDELILAVKEHFDGIEPFKLPDPYGYYDEESETTINGLENLKISIADGDVKYVDNEFYIPVIVEADADIEYFIDKSEAITLPNNRKITLTDCNRHVYFAEENVKVMLKQTLVVTAESIDKDSDLEIEFEDLEEAEVN